VCGALAGVVQGVLRGLTFSDHLEGGLSGSARTPRFPYILAIFECHTI